MADAGNQPADGPPTSRPPADRSARAQPAAPRADQGQLAVLRILLALTLLSGVVDAVSYLGLGRVFTANMTGNVVVLGFAAAGAPGFSVTASLTSLLLFLAGAVTGGRLRRRMTGRSRLLAIAICCEAGFVGAAAIVAFLATSVASGWARYTVIAILAFAMGIRNSVIRHLGIPGRHDHGPHPDADRPGSRLAPGGRSGHRVRATHCRRARDAGRRDRWRGPLPA